MALHIFNQSLLLLFVLLIVLMNIKAVYKTAQELGRFPLPGYIIIAISIYSLFIQIENFIYYGILKGLQ